MDIERDVSLKELTTFHIGGPARYFVRAQTIRDLENAYAFARQMNLPVFLLGGGSNVLIADAGFSGLVIKNEIRGVSFEAGNEDEVYAYAGAGESWDAFVRDACKEELAGIENLSGIPGTVGAAPVQNIGAYGTELADVLEWVDVFDTHTLTTQRLSNSACAFSYRDSIFKKPEGARFVITRICVKLSKNKAPNIAYKDLAQHFKDSAPNIAQVRSAVVRIRRQKFPGTPKIGTAGSFFKNPIVAERTAQRLKEAYPDMPSYSASDGSTKLSAAWLLEHVGGFKGIQRGDAGVWKHHALVLVNYDSATAADVHGLAREMQNGIRQKTNVTLEQEVRCIGACSCASVQEGQTQTENKKINKKVIHKQRA